MLQQTGVQRAVVGQAFDRFRFRRGLGSSSNMGLGDLIEEGSDGEWIYDQENDVFYPVGTGGGDRSSPNPWSVQIPSLIAGGLQTIRDIFAPVGSTQAAYGAQRPAVVYQPQGATYTAQQRSSGVGIGLDGQGIRLSDGSHISWIWIIGGIAIIFLIQSPGFSRRRNPARKLLAKRNPARRRNRRPRARRRARRR